MATFTAQLQRFSEKAKAKQIAVVKMAAQEVFSIALTPIAQGGRMPVDTGFLRNTSQVSSINGGQNLSGPNAYTLAIAQMESGDVLLMGWTAAYGPRMEHGFTGTDSLGRTYNFPGYHFAYNAAAQWQSVVNMFAAQVAD